ncbi:hypothetical protein GGR58DRAFT_474500 [Xylaria digitata]|nr:hypothetical protein GGR58DRAFT_474500 [Xylaria digitata]
MGSRKKAKYATAPSHQQHVPSSTTTPVGFTSSDMIVQERSPPLSSPPPLLSSAFSSEQIDEFPDGTGVSRSGPSRPSTKHGHTIQSATTEKSVAQSQEAAEIEARAQSGMSRSERADTQQTTKLIKVLVKNKALLYNCIAEAKDEDDEECKKIMRKISVAVKDDRFQTWRQVKLWTMRHYRRRLRSIKSLPPATTKAKRKSNISLLWKSFDKNLVPLLKAAEMAINTKHFLNSVIDAIGKRKLTRIFKHRLTCDELPEDIAPLIFSPLYIRICERRTRELKSARNSNDSESDGSDDEWSDWEEEGDLLLDEGSNRGDGLMAVTGTHFHILPSIEEENNNSRESDPPDLAPGQKPDKPSTPLTFRGSESCATEVRMSRKARRRHRRKSRRRMGHDKRGTGDNDADRRRRRTLTSPRLSSPCDDSARRPAPNPPQVQNRATERARSRKGIPELPSPSALRIRPFADIMSPTATVTPDPDTESLFRLKDFFYDENKRNEGASLRKDGTREATMNPRKCGTNPTAKKTATKDRGKDVPISNGRGGTERTSRPKGGAIPGPHKLPPVRRTPAILIEENKRQARKLAKPLAPTMIPSRVPPRKEKSPLQARRVHKEVRPKAFYSSLTGGTTAIPRVNPEAQVEGTSQPKPPDHTGGTMGSRYDIDNKENGAKGSSMVPNNIPRQRSSSHQSSLSDETNLPSIEELYKHLIQERAQIQPGTTKRKRDNKRRLGREASSEHHGPSAKRIKISAGRSLLSSSEMARWAKDVAHANLQMNDGKRRGGPSPWSKPDVFVPAPSRRKRSRRSKTPWMISSHRTQEILAPIV